MIPALTMKKTKTVAGMPFGSINIDKLLESCGARNITHSGDEVSYSCPFPEHRHGDKSPSAGMNVKSTAWICFGCGRSGNAVTLTSEIFDVSTYQAINWLRQIWGTHLTSMSLKDRQVASNQITEELVDLGIIEHDDSGEADRVALHSVMRDWEKIERESMTSPSLHDDFGITRGFYPRSSHGSVDSINANSGFLSWNYRRAGDAAYFPYRDILTAHVIGWKERKVGTKVYKNPSGFKASDHLYMIDSVDVGDNIVLCEGEIDALSMALMIRREHGRMVDSSGVKTSVVGISGSRVSPKQIALLRDITDSVTICFDADLAGRKGSLEAAEELSRHMHVRIADIDPDELGCDVNDYLASGVTDIPIQQIKRAHTLVQKTINQSCEGW